MTGCRPAAPWTTCGGLLVEHALLPPRDARLARYSNWLEDKLAGITDLDIRQLAERFGRWHHLRRLRDQARQGEVSENAFLRAKQSTTVAINFLGWLTDRGRTLGDCTQHDLDAWFAGGTSTRGHAGVFLYWARNQRLLPQLDIPGREPDSHPELGGQDRLQLLRGVLVHETLPLPHRVAAGLLLLFGQPAHRIAALRADQVHCDGPDIGIRLADDVLDVPEPFAALLRAHLAARPNLATAAHRESPWLFPGVSPGRHLSVSSLVAALRAAGIPALASRTATWTELVRDAPPQVLARALGISPTTAMRHADRASADWTGYAALARSAPNRQI